MSVTYGPTRTDSIKALLLQKALPDLAALYTHDMECQVNVAQDGGQRVESEYKGRLWQGWTDGIQTWKSFRIPYNASTNPQYDDSRRMSFDLEAHAEAIGMTGWDWKKKLSRWVAYDFDAITGHADRHSKKLEESEINRIIEILKAVEWVTLRRSTGGRGLHLYIFLEPVLTDTHTEHAALARAILGKLSALTGYDFNTAVDICGQNIWVWHRKSAITPHSLELLKHGERLVDIPPKWKDHIQVVKGERNKTRVWADFDSPESNKFEDLTSQMTKVPLDEGHKLFLNWLEIRARGSWWDSDHHMLVSHTYWLRQAHEELSLKGVFTTISAGSEAPSDINCYLFPLRRGGWVVRRYSLGVQESDTWEQDGKGWTRCYYNTEPNLHTVARMHDGLEDPSGGYIFNEAETAAEAARILGAAVPQIPSGLRNEIGKLKMHKDGSRIVMEIEGDATRAVQQSMEGWLFKKGKWIKIFNINVPAAPEIEGTNYDDLIRHLITEHGDDAGWGIKGENDKWRREPLAHIQRALESLALKPQEVKNAIGGSIFKCWTLVNRPFQPEYPGNRIWNERAAQLKFIPSREDNLYYPHWLKVLNHIGKGLDEPLKNHPWAQANNIKTGADYFKIWLASIIKEPLQPLPYVFLFGPQNSGKSIFHEAVSLLFTSGYARADVSLVNPQGFNEELANAVLCVVEEIDLKKDKNAANRIKDWVTAREISIHAKFKKPYHVPNSTHWVQAANEITACPVFPGDTRITMSYVESMSPLEMIPKRKLLEEMEKEAPDFLAELLRTDIPPTTDRLNIPVIVTADKAQTEAYARNQLESFIHDSCYQVDGETILMDDFYRRFIEWCDPTDSVNWSKIRVGRELPPCFPKGRITEGLGGGRLFVGNISFTPLQPGEKKKPRLRATAPDIRGTVFLRSEIGASNGNVHERNA